MLRNDNQCGSTVQSFVLAILAQVTPGKNKWRANKKCDRLGAFLGSFTMDFCSFFLFCCLFLCSPLFSVVRAMENVCSVYSNRPQMCNTISWFGHILILTKWIFCFSIFICCCCCHFGSQCWFVSENVVECAWP